MLWVRIPHRETLFSFLRKKEELFWVVLNCFPCLKVFYAPGTLAAVSACTLSSVPSEPHTLPPQHLSSDLTQQNVGHSGVTGNTLILEASHFYCKCSFISSVSILPLMLLISHSNAPAIKFQAHDHVTCVCRLHWGRWFTLHCFSLPSVFLQSLACLVPQSCYSLAE